MSASDQLASPSVHDQPPAAQRPGLGRAVSAIAWAFLGIRQRGASEKDAAQISPLHWVMAGLGAGLVFVLTLAWLVHWVAGR